MTSLTRRYQFSASHRLHSPLLSDAENARVFGKCNNPYGHGHDYTLEVTISGPIDPLSGLLMPVSDLDRLVKDCVLARFAHRNLNVDVTEFQDLIPTTENVAVVIAALLQQGWESYISPASARLARVQIHETDRNSFEVLLPAAVGTSVALNSEARKASSSIERVPVHA